MNKTAKPRKLLSVPLSAEQHEALARRAGRQPVSAYARDRLFPANDNHPARKASSRVRIPLKNTAALAGLLALLGPVSQGLKQLAQGIASGILPLAPDAEAAVLKACADIAEMKALLMAALGVKQR